MKFIFMEKRTDMVLIISWILAAVSAFFVRPDMQYLTYIDWRSLGILWSLMVITKGLMENGVFEKIGHAVLSHTQNIRQVSAVLIGLCFFASMLITNDVSLITFVPFAIMLLKSCRREELMIPVIVLQTIAANLGSMLTPIGNPQNLYLYGISGMSMTDFLSLMLPYTAISALLLVISVFMLKNGHELITPQAAQNLRLDSITKARIAIYMALFAEALLTVARILPWQALAISVLAVTSIMQRNILKKADYGLLLTFIGFFIFTGNMGRVPELADFLSGVINGHTVGVGVLTSQMISNVPAALLLSGFTCDYYGLIVGVNLGGLGTLIASMASLISYKLYANEAPDRKMQYLGIFSLYNIIFLGVLILFNFIFHI